LNVFATALETLGDLQPRELSGTVVSIRGLTILVERLRIPVGSRLHGPW
jgi:hypothetical protein